MARSARERGLEMPSQVAAKGRWRRFDAHAMVAQHRAAAEGFRKTPGAHKSLDFGNDLIELSESIIPVLLEATFCYLHMELKKEHLLG